MLKEMLSRETAEPGPGPSSVLNCSQNLQEEEEQSRFHYFTATERLKSFKLRQSEDDFIEHHSALASEDEHCMPTTAY